MPGQTFTVGICATDDGSSLQRLLDRISDEQLPPGCSISDVVIVVSGSTDGTDRIARLQCSRFRKIVIVESRRHGKATAVNRIMGCMGGASLILINGDAVPEPGAVAALMTSLAYGGCAVVCGMPLPAECTGRGLAKHASSFLWLLHNNTMEILRLHGESIHLTDEMMGINHQALHKLPPGTVNDGAYIAARAQHYGQHVSFCREAVVSVSRPATIHGLAEQRRRILFGHMRVREMTGYHPATAEFKFLERPLLVLRIIYRSLKECPEGLLILPLMLAVELSAFISAVRDRRSEVTTHEIWTRVENATWR